MNTVIVTNRTNGNTDLTRSVARAAWYFRGIFHIEQIRFALSVEDVELTSVQVRRILNRVAERVNRHGWYRLRNPRIMSIPPLHTRQAMRGQGINAFKFLGLDPCHT